ncbi:hypothetical protein BH23ACT5_BH23ACT5_20120 [soil metagenome]
MPEGVRWWAFRRAQNLSASVYRCPICDDSIPALSEHMLLTPEGDGRRRRHAHTECVAEARHSGRLPTWDEWQATQPKGPSWWQRLRSRVQRG